LGHGFRRSQAVQAGHQGIVQRGGNRDTRQGPREDIMGLFLPQEVGFQEHPGQLLDKQGHPISLNDNMLYHLPRQRLTPRQVPDQRFDLRAVQAVQGERRDMRAR
jgi:hypothetical protein